MDAELQPSGPLQHAASQTAFDDENKKPVERPGVPAAASTQHKLEVHAARTLSCFLLLWQHEQLLPS